jgi:HEAT repeat protein
MKCNILLILKHSQNITNDQRGWVLSLLSDPNDEVKIEATRALSQLSIRQPDEIKILLSALSDPNWEIRLEVVRALELVIDYPEVREALLEALSDANLVFRLAAISALQESGTNDLGIRVDV